MAKYISGLKYSIQERVILHDVFSVDEAHNRASKIERLQSSAPPFKHLMPNEKPSGGKGIQLSSMTDDLLSTQQ